MAITDLTVAAASTGNSGAGVTPVAPSGVLPGDLVLIYSAIRNTAGRPVTPTGWTKVVDVGNVAVMGRWWQVGDVMPQIAFDGGVALADTFARAMKMRGAGKDALTEITYSSSSISAQNINIPAYDTPGAGHLVVLLAWKQDDATSLGTPPGWTAQGTTMMTAGDDMLAGWFTQLQTIETDIGAGNTIAVTGGVVAQSFGIIFSIKPAPAITVTSFDLFPPRNLIAITGLTPGDNVDVYRVANGERTLLRGQLVGATDPSFTVVDGELPFGTPVSYVAVVNSVGEYTTSSASYTLPGGKPILSDAITGQASQFVIRSWDEKTYERQASVFKVAGRNVVVAGDIGMFEAQVEIFFDAWSSSKNFLALLDSATENVLQLRRPIATYDGVDCYVAVLSARERRFSQDGTDPRRTWVLSVAETEAWSPGQLAAAFTWADVENFYTGLTWDDLDDDHATWLALLQADLS